MTKTSRTPTHRQRATTTAGTSASTDGYYDHDDANDTDTDDEPESTAHMSHTELEQYLGYEPLPSSIEDARCQYLLAKRRFRHMTGKTPRHFRSPRRFKGGGKGNGRSHSKGKGKGKGSGKSRGWPPSVFKGYTPLSNRSLAGGKGKGAGRKGNPTGADGKNMAATGATRKNT